MTQPKFHFAAITLLFLAACQTEPATQPASKPATVAPSAQAAPVAQPAPAKSVPAAPIVPLAQKAPESAPAAAEDTSRSGRLAVVKHEYGDAMDAYYDLFKDAKTDEDYDAITKTAKRPDENAFRSRARVIVDEDPTDAAALDAITWMLTVVRGGNDMAELLAIVEKHHMKSDKLVPLVRLLASDSSGPAVALVEKLVKESPYADVRGTALYGMAQAKQRDIDSARKIQAAKNEKDAEKLAKRYGPERAAKLKALDVPAAQKQVEDQLERTVAQFADVPYGKSTLGERARADLFETRSLSVGKVAPDIEGEDLSGTKFHLSDYRGKVVLLDFWGNW